MTFLIVFHPTDKSPQDFENLLEALNRYVPTDHLIFIKANCDAGGQEINNLIENYYLKRKMPYRVYDNLPRQEYLEMLTEVDAIVGNSSSGIIEAPGRTRTINIGNRQTGRLKANSVIDCDDSIDGIVEAIKKIEFEDYVLESMKPYMGNNGAEKIVEILKKQVGDK